MYGHMQDAKAKLKAEKAAKAKQKEQERLAQAKAKEQGGGDSKKAKLKKEAEAKKVQDPNALLSSLSLSPESIWPLQICLAWHICIRTCASPMAAITCPGGDQRNERECVLQAAEDDEVAKRLEAVRAIPKGQKKDYGAEMLKGYDPKYVEAAT